ncbi:NUDIX hydrolase [uncultured Propionibacterium sp.]|uniref:NUDIX hydrolase n=1 Tax=uncultured Propionibacterium sp. TaxID=218066 RepID=UPI00292F4DC7|nr:NUDIX hydrolase [uncultured Propionibacterium sp.]
MVDDFQVRVVVEDDIGVLHWSGYADQPTLDEAVSLAADDSLIGRGLRRVEASVPATDRLAQRALHKAGFRREGRRRRAVPDGNGGFIDALLYARLIEDQVYGMGAMTAIMDSVMPAHRIIGHVLIRDEHGRVLFVEPTYKDDWELPGGVVEADESPRAGAIREVHEELGVRIELADQPLVTDWMPPYLGWHDAIEFVFDGGRIASGDIEGFVPPPEEIRGYHWVMPAEIPSRVRDFSARRIAGILDGTGLGYTEGGFPIGPVPPGPR